MAHHNSTPASVLEAPGITRTFVEGTEFSGPNRAERRHFKTASGRVIHLTNPESYSRTLFKRGR